MDISTQHTQMFYDPETGFFDSSFLKIRCHQNTAYENAWQGHGRGGKFSYNHVNLREGLDIWRFKHIVSRHMSIASLKGEPAFTFRFCLQGQTSVYHVREKKQFGIKAGQQGLCYTDTENIASLQPDLPLDLIGIFVSPPCLEAWLGNDMSLISKKLRAVLEGKNEGVPCYSRGITRTMRNTLSRMSHCPYTDVTRKLFLESCALELVCLQLEAFRGEEGKKSGSDLYCRPLCPRERRQINRIRERIQDDPDKALSLGELASEAGMSQSKLSRLFKEVYGTTVFSYLRNTRLDLAAQMLTQGMTVTETAFGVGYENLSYFSKVFKKRFGKSPTRFRH